MSISNNPEAREKSIANIKEKRPVKPPSRKQVLKKMTLTERTELEQMEWLMFKRVEDADKQLDLVKTALALEYKDNEKVQKSIDKLGAEVAQLRLDVTEQIRKGLNTQKMNRAITDKTADINSKRGYLSYAPERLAPLEAAVKAAETDKNEAVRKSLLSPEILGVYRKRFCEAFEQMYTVFCDARICIGTIAQNGFAVLSEPEIMTAVCAADFYNENHVTIEEDSDFLWGKDRNSNIWDEIIFTLSSDKVRAKQLNELVHPYEEEEVEVPGSEELVPMLREPRNMILPDSQSNYPDSDINAAKLKAERLKPRHGVELGKLAPYSN